MVLACGTANSAKASSCEITAEPAGEKSFCILDDWHSEYAHERLRSMGDDTRETTVKMVFSVRNSNCARLTYQ